MIARPKISRNEWKTAEIGAFEVGNFALLSCPAGDLRVDVLERLHDDLEAAPHAGRDHAEAHAVHVDDQDLLEHRDVRVVAARREVLEGDERLRADRAPLEQVLGVLVGQIDARERLVDRFGDHLGRNRVIQRRFNVSVPRARVP